MKALHPFIAELEKEYILKGYLVSGLGYVLAYESEGEEVIWKYPVKLQQIAHPNNPGHVGIGFQDVCMLCDISVCKKPEKDITLEFLNIKEEFINHYREHVKQQREQESGIITPNVIDISSRKH